ncbi:helix-turn-helix transcriptional regulator [Pseudofrankia saprophytica]|uniref:helix-turn-helix transcriptional regulator n=1 Tax=Pseudofrankia saprophytica TaxID=298655 RepID=UPI000234CA33|nr:helix-turn-helix transcriptional regulator [Pseudofrankia saprophytica]
MIAEQGLSGQVAYVRAHLAELVLGAGDPARAQRLLDATLADLAAQPAPSVQAWCLLLRADARLRLVGPDDAADDVAAARREGAACGNLWQQALADHIAGRIAQARGDLNQAAALLRRALVLRVEAGYRPDAADSLEALASVHAARREDAAAARLLAAAAAVWDEIGWCRRPVDQADHEAGERTVRDRLGDDAVAATLAEARAAGADASLAAAATAANRTPAHRTPHTPEGWDGLTPLERDVVRLVAQGLSNPEIARRLFMARATVKVHLTHVFAKLGIASRAELAAEAGRREHLGTSS